MENGKHADHRFFGSVTVGERGQVVIPAEARKHYGINSGDKLLVFGSFGGIVFLKIDRVSKLVASAMDRLSSLEKLLKEVDSEPHS